MEDKVLNFNNIVNELLDQFPEFHQSHEFEVWSDEVTNQYLVFVGFSNYIKEKIHENENLKVNDEIKRIFDFLNQMQASEDTQLKTLVMSQVIEAVAQDSLALKVAKQLLSGKNIEYLNEYLRK